jgi:YesN/AraC family two-component response regulator
MAISAVEKIRILIVDDIAETRENIRKLLQFESDMEVVGGARTGGEAIDLARETQPDVVLMDINMPDMDGISATKALLDDVPYAQIVILSVNNEPDYMRRAMLAGARDFIAKPPSPDELISTIRGLEAPASRRELAPQAESFLRYGLTAWSPAAGDRRQRRRGGTTWHELATVTPWRRHRRHLSAVRRRLGLPQSAGEELDRRPGRPSRRTRQRRGGRSDDGA